jgi:GntR family transcriptional regulator/MocR family aminotransferase
VFAGTASETLAPGLRLGWLLLPRTIVEPVVAIRRVEDVHVPAPDKLAFSQLRLSGAFERHVRRMRARYRVRRDRPLPMLAERVATATPVGISAGLRVLLELLAEAPSAAELAERAAQQSIELFPVGRCYHSGRAIRDGLVIGYAALPEHAFESGVTALGDFLERSLSS